MRKAWITVGILNSTHNKEFIFNLLKSNPNNSDLKKYYNKCLKKLIIAAKIINDNDKVKSIRNNSRKFWNFIDGKLGRKNKNNNNSFPKKIINDD